MFSISLLSFLFNSIRTYWKSYSIGLFFLLLTNWLAVQIPLQLAQAIDALHKKSNALASSAIFTIFWMGIAIIFVRTFSRVFFFTPGRLIEFNMKNKLFAHLLTLQPSFYAKASHGDLLSRLSNDMTYIRVMAGFGTLQFFNVSAAFLLTGIAMLSLSVKLTLFILLPIFLAMLIVHRGIERLFELTKQNQEKLSDLSEHILSSIQGISTIQGFLAHDAFSRRFEAKNRDYMQSHLRLVKIRAWYLPALGLAGAFCTWLIFALSGSLVQENHLTVGQLVALFSYVAYLIIPLRSLGWMISVFQSGQTSLTRIHSLFDESPERPEYPDTSNPSISTESAEPSESIDSSAPKLPISQRQQATPEKPHVPLESRQGSEPPFGSSPTLVCQHLSFSYPDAPEAAVLQDVSFTAPAGKLIGIFGRTGAGKTTLLRLIARLYNPPQGSILCNGRDIRSFDLDAWRRYLAYAPQMPFLFSESIEDNIAMGVIEPARLSLATQLAALERDLEALPDGLKTIVGERGVMLSGGQRQRTALARTFYRRFDLLLLDDILSAVDHHTELQIIESLRRVASSEAPPTILLVSNRLSALAQADHILVLEQGRITAQGSHAQLIEEDGIYKETWFAQHTEE